MSPLRRNILINVVGNVIVATLSLVGVKFVFRGLGPDALGIIYFTLLAAGATAAVLEMGINSTAVKEVAANRSTNPEYVRRLAQSGALAYWTVYVVAAVAFYLAAPLIVHRWIKLTTTDPATATHALRVLGVSALTVIPQRFYAAVFRGLERLHVNNSIDVLGLAAQQLGAIVLISQGASLSAVATWFAFTFALTLMLYLVNAGFALGFGALRPRLAPDVLKKNLEYTKGMTSLSILGMIYTQGDKLLLAKLLPIGVVGNYTFTYYMLQRASILTDAVVNASFPAFSRVSVDGEGAVAQQFGKVMAVIIIGSSVIFTGFAMLLPNLLAVLLSPDVAASLAVPGALLALGFYLHAAIYVPYIVSVALGRPEIAVRCNVAALFGVVPVTAFLVARYGMLGAALGWVVYHVFTVAYLFPRVCGPCMGLPWRPWVRHSLSPVVPAAVGFLLLTAGNPEGTQRGWAVCLTAWVVTAIACAVVGYATLPREAKGWVRTAATLRRPSTVPSL